jgi:DNA primase
MFNYPLYEDLKERIAVHEYDGYFMALCPFHEKRTGHPDNRPSFMVHADGYKCKGADCGAHGTLEYLNEYLGGHAFDGVATERSIPVLPQWRKWYEQYHSVQGIAETGHWMYCNDVSLRSYFVKRGYGDFYKIGMFGWLDWWNMFPVFDQAHRVIDIVVRAGDNAKDTKYVLLKKPEEHHVPPVYVPDWELFMSSTTIYVPFGMFDAWAIRSIGVPSLTGTTGKSLNADRLYELGKNWIIVPDEHEEEDAWRLKMELGSRAQVLIPDYPFRTKDPDGVLHRYGPQALSQLLGVKL